jgi:hypothetical protein
MTLHRRVVGLTALVSFLAIAAWSAGFVPSPCCSPACDPCPVMFGKAAAAESSPKVSIAAPAVASGIESRLTAAAPESARTVTRVASLLSHEFLRPMRN